jgi:hypothetical protein
MDEFAQLDYVNRCAVVSLVTAFVVNTVILIVIMQARNAPNTAAPVHCVCTYPKGRSEAPRTVHAPVKHTETTAGSAADQKMAEVESMQSITVDELRDLVTSNTNDKYDRESSTTEKTRGRKSFMRG